MTKRVDMGHRGRDLITGFEGVVTGHCQYISGCNQVLLSPKVDEKGGKVDAEWFDEQRVEEIEAEPILLDNGATPGFDKAPARR
jgi:hypothetical protein